MVSAARAERYQLRPITARCNVRGCDRPASRLVRSTSDRRLRAACLKCFRLMTEYEAPNWEPA